MAAQHQSLLNSPFEAMMALFGVAVFVGTVGLGFGRLKAVMATQVLIALGELLGITEIVDRRTEAVCPMVLRYPAKFPEARLKTLAETLETFGITQHAGLPIGIVQNEMVDHMRERASGDRNPQFAHSGKV